MNAKFPVNVPEISELDIEFVTKALRESWISGDGKYVKEFEFKFGEYIGSSNVISVSSGSNALELIFSVLDFSPGDEIIMPRFTIISCLLPIIRNGLKPVFVDSLFDTWNPNIEEIYSKVTPRTKAILYVHMYGLGNDLSELATFAKSKNIFLIEDCAEVHGSRYNGKHMGTFGDIGVFSFYANKVITTGEGGAINVKDAELAEKLRKARNLGFGEIRFIHEVLGWNFRLSNLLAALGVAQLERIDKFLETKRRIANVYKMQLVYKEKAEIDCDNTSQKIIMQPEWHNGIQNTFWVCGILMPNLDKQKITTLRDKLLKFEDDGWTDTKLLDRRIVHKGREGGVETRSFFYPLDLQPIFLDYAKKHNLKIESDRESLVADYLYDHGFYLPSGTGMSEIESLEISKIFKNVVHDIQ
jgi:perosamine synthetase